MQLFGYEFRKIEHEPNFRVRVRLDGTHPYLDKYHLEVPADPVVVEVYGKSWQDAANAGVHRATELHACWSAYAVSVEKIMENAGDMPDGCGIIRPSTKEPGMNEFDKAYEDGYNAYHSVEPHMRKNPFWREKNVNARTWELFCSWDRGFADASWDVLHAPKGDL